MAQEHPGVQLAPVEERLVLEETRLNGTVNALRASRLSAAVAGLVEKVAVEIGDTVSPGDLVIALDDERAEHELASARARRQEAEANLDDARRRLSEAQSVGAGRNIAATEIRSRASAVESAEAALARTQADVRRFRTALEKHRVTAPFSGVVSARSRDLGEWVTPGDELLTLVDQSNLRLDFSVAQEFYYALSGDSELLLVSGPGGSEPVPLAINTVVPVTDPVSRTFLLRATAPEKVELMPGMSVVALLRVSTGERGLTVPRDAINRYPEGRVTVWVAKPAEGQGLYTVSEHRVKTGGGFDQWVEILEGVSAGDRVVSRGNEALNEGMTVKISEREAR
ncbi:efflux RND transporter periplasmic adaptor subunit [Marinobacter daqiaonensis]|nr:efflux RND transporter periplasmic adaptor subunit [Marinobacter daqiaonensis]